MSDPVPIIPIEAYNKSTFDGLVNDLLYKDYKLASCNTTSSFVTPERSITVWTAVLVHKDYIP